MTNQAFFLPLGKPAALCLERLSMTFKSVEKTLHFLSKRMFRALTRARKAAQKCSYSLGSVP